MESKVKYAWIIGASSGIGQALAIQMAQAGWQVAISARRVDVLHTMQAHHPQLHAYALDVTDLSSVQQAHAAMIKKWGRLDICVVNAGDYVPMPLADFKRELFIKLNAVNYLGVINVLEVILPTMLQQAQGQILLTASLAGYAGLPKSAPYSASKAAVINLAESLHLELKQRGVLLRVINPGFVRSALTAKNNFKMPFLIEPDQAAQAIMRDLDKTHFEIVFPKRFAWLMKLLRLMPYAVYFALTKRAAV